MKCKSISLALRKIYKKKYERERIERKPKCTTRGKLMKEIDGIYIKIMTNSEKDKKGGNDGWLFLYYL